MNHFSDKFVSRIRSFWDNSGEREKKQLLDDILQYANSNSQTFKKEIDEIRFDKDLLPLPIVLEALSKDTANWGQFYVDLLDDIFETAKQLEKPNEILTNLMEFAHIEKDDKPFIQKIADRLYKELSTDNLETKLAAICTLPSYLDNKTIKNKNVMVDALQQLLTDSNWKVRVVTFKALGFENLLPSGHKLSFTDKLFKLILGEPQTI
ncbi:MAG: hypothetical protein V4511_10055 [Bacteroidota bacterium]